MFQGVGCRACQRAERLVSACWLSEPHPKTTKVHLPGLLGKYTIEFFENPLYLQLSLAFGGVLQGSRELVSNQRLNSATIS